MMYQFQLFGRIPGQPQSVLILWREDLTLLGLSSGKGTRVGIRMGSVTGLLSNLKLVSVLQFLCVQVQTLNFH